MLEGVIQFPNFCMRAKSRSVVYQVTPKRY